MALLELLDRNELQRLQDEFCGVAGVNAYCLDHDGTKITRLSGEDRYTYPMQEEMAFERVSGEGSLEDLAVEEIPGHGQVAAMAIQARGMRELYWIVYSSERMSETAFYQCLELLRDASVSLLQGRIRMFGAEAESIRQRSAGQRLEKSMQMLQATTHILRLLESQEPAEEIMNDWLREVGTFLELDTAQIFKLQKDGKSMDVICEWRRQGVVSFFEKTSQVPTYSFLLGREAKIIGTDQIRGEEYRELFALGVMAVMLFPLCPDEEGTEFVLSGNSRKARTFEEEEVRFAADAVKVLDNILMRRIQKNSLSSARTALESILDHVNTCIYVRDERRRRMIFANKLMQNTFGEEIKGGTFRWLLDGFEESADGALEYGRELHDQEKDRWYDLSVGKIRWWDGSEARLYSLYDITEKKHYKGRIERQAYTDFLTGLYNRICCERDLAVQIDSAKKQKMTGALLYLDLDDFKHINDGLGHQYGDELLKAISSAFQRIPEIERTCYRMGGDEFVIVIPPEAYDKLEEILADIQKVFRTPWFLKDSDYYCTMSMGVVTFPDNGDSVPDLVKKADIAMYAAKKAGKNRIEFYSNSIASSDRRRLDMEKNMRDASAEDFGEFEVYYQPIIDVSGEEAVCAGAEALIRWNSRKLGFVMPVEFIPLAEYLGLINPIGNHVLLEACRQCREWNERGFDYKVNVNLSVVQLLQRDIVDIVSNALIGTGLAPEHLTLEVTESLAINDMERMKRILGNIKELGVKIALDDFGTGYSSLNHIREIPFDIIKVDQSFVKDLAEDAYSQSFIKLVSELAETIGVSICVEGIETAMQHQVLQGMRVKYIQGYYFDKPMSREDFEKKYCRKPVQQAAPEKTGVQQTAPEKTSVQQTVPEKTSVQQTAPEKTGVQQAAPEKTGVQQATPEKTGVQQTAPEKTGVQQTAPEREAEKPEAPKAAGKGRRRRPAGGNNAENVSQTSDTGNGEGHGGKSGKIVSIRRDLKE